MQSSIILSTLGSISCTSELYSIATVDSGTNTATCNPYNIINQLQLRDYEFISAVLNHKVHIAVLLNSSLKYPNTQCCTITSTLHSYKVNSFTKQYSLKSFITIDTDSITYQALIYSYKHLLSTCTSYSVFIQSILEVAHSP